MKKYAQRLCRCVGCPSTELNLELGVKLHSFPKPWNDEEACRRWILGTGDVLLRVQDIGYRSYLCSKHFVGGRGPTEQHPDPVPFIRTFPSNQKKGDDMELDSHMSSDNYHVVDIVNERAISEECRLKGMCRICSASKSKLISIFGDLGTKTAVSDLIHTYLPILVTPDDLLPTSICSRCLTTLTASQTLVETCIDADKKMRLILDSRLSHHIQVNNVTEIFPKINSDESASNMNERIGEADGNLFARLPVKVSYVGIKPSLNVTKLDIPQNFDVAINTAEVPIRPSSCYPTTGGKGKLYRCLYCSHTDSDAYVLFLHQVKAHPDNFLKCSNCDFVCSSDQINKYDDHQKLHKNTNCTKDHLNQIENEENVDDPEVIQSLSCDDRGAELLGASNENVKLIQNSTKGSEHETKSGECSGSSVTHMSSLNTGAALLSEQTSSPALALEENVSREGGTVPKTDSLTLSCQSCPAVFNDSDEYGQHLMTHKSSIQCTVCKAHFRANYFLKVHMKKHEEKQNLKCPHCSRVFHLRSRLRVHMRIHTGETPYMCVICGKRFSTDSGFRLHMRAHDGSKPYVCAKCGHRCNRPSNLRRHEATCRSESRLKCRICSEGFKTWDELLCHRATHSKEERDAARMSKDNEKTQDRFSCKVCGMKFDKVADLAQHRQLTHTIAELDEAKKAGRVDGGAYVCPKCGKELYNKKNYDAHLLRHSGQAQHQCAVCSNVYATKFALDYHMYTHTGERPFKCDVCSEGFKSNFNLRVHRLKHTGEKPFKCRQCTLRFFTTHSLRLHLVSHSDIRQFSCQYCSATFKRKRTLTTHIRVHTGEKPYGCRYCDKHFTQKGTCTLHERKHLNIKHPQEKHCVKVRKETHKKLAVGRAPDVPCQNVAIIEDWNGQETEPDASTATIGVLVAPNSDPTLVVTESAGGNQEDPMQRNASVPDLSDQTGNGGVQHMVLIHQTNRDESGEGMVVDEHMVLVKEECIETTHAIIIGQDGTSVSEDATSS